MSYYIQDILWVGRNLLNVNFWTSLSVNALCVRSLLEGGKHGLLRLTLYRMLTTQFPVLHLSHQKILVPFLLLCINYDNLSVFMLFFWENSSFRVRKSCTGTITAIPVYFLFFPELVSNVWGIFWDLLIFFKIKKNLIENYLGYPSNRS